jgi:hypothetical protein
VIANPNFWGAVVTNLLFLYTVAVVTMEEAKVLSIAMKRRRRRRRRTSELQP